MREQREGDKVRVFLNDDEIGTLLASVVTTKTLSIEVNTTQLRPVHYEQSDNSDPDLPPFLKISISSRGLGLLKGEESIYGENIAISYDAPKVKTPSP